MLNVEACLQKLPVKSMKNHENSDMAPDTTSKITKNT